MSDYLPLLILLVFGSWLSVIDIRTHRLPNRIVALSSALLLIVEGVLALTQSQLPRLVNAITIAGASVLIYALLYVISRGAMGMGDVKFAFPLGLAVGWYRPEYWLATIFLTFSLAGLVALSGIALKRASWKSQLALGPYMFLAATVVCAISI